MPTATHSCSSSGVPEPQRHLVVSSSLAAAPGGPGPDEVGEAGTGLRAGGRRGPPERRGERRPGPERDSSQGVDDGERPDLDRILADPSAPTLVFQPIVDLRLGVVAGYEALARFGARLADAPYLVFAEANRRGCAAELEARVLRAALAARDRLPARCFLAVNVSPHLLASPEVTAVWRDANPSRLVLELNDAVAFDGEAALNATLEALRKAGAFIAMDDVGSGYAGLRQPTRTRPDFVKLDRSLVTHIDDDPVKIALTELVRGIASRVNGWVIAEGVERLDELTALVAMGVPLGQGYLLGRPAQQWQELDPAVAARIRQLANAGTGRRTSSASGSRSAS